MRGFGLSAMSQSESYALGVMEVRRKYIPLAQSYQGLSYFSYLNAAIELCKQV
jgi:hypothetical protein